MNVCHLVVGYFNNIPKFHTWLVIVPYPLINTHPVLTLISVPIFCPIKSPIKVKSLTVYTQKQTSGDFPAYLPQSLLIGIEKQSPGVLDGAFCAFRNPP